MEQNAERVGDAADGEDATDEDADDGEDATDADAESSGPLARAKTIGGEAVGLVVDGVLDAL